MDFPAGYVLITCHHFSRARLLLRQDLLWRLRGEEFPRFFGRVFCVPFRSINVQELPSGYSN